MKPKTVGVRGKKRITPLPEPWASDLVKHYRSKESQEWMNAPMGKPMNKPKHRSDLLKQVSRYSYDERKRLEAQNAELKLNLTICMVALGIISTTSAGVKEIKLLADEALYKIKGEPK